MELQNIIQEMDRLQIELDRLRPIPEERMGKLMQKLRLDWNYHSNSIEGNTLSASETKAFILFGITAKGKPFRDYIEMRGHNEALKKVEEIVHKDISITETLIKDLHKLILVEAYSDSEAEINPGHYKTRPNYLYSTEGERVDFAMPNEVAEKMNRLVNWLNNHLDPPKRKKKQYDAHPLLIACIFHLEFIRIHPFGDGNGRLARILMNLILMTCGYVPSIVRLEKRKDYYGALNLSEVDNISPLAEFIGEECIVSMQLAIKAAKNEPIEEDDDLDKEILLFKRALNKTNESNEIKSDEIIKTILKNSGVVLFSRLINSLSKFNDLFHESEVRFIFTEKERDSYDILQRSGGLMLFINDQFPESFISWLDKREGRDFSQFGIEFYWKGYRLSTPKFNVGVYANFKFDKFSYHISRVTNFDGLDHYLENSYENQLSQEDINYTVSNIAKDIMRHVKENHYDED